MEKDRKRVRASRELKDLKERSFDELVARRGSIARGYDFEWLSKTVISKFVQSFIKDKDQCNVEEDIVEEQEEEDIVEEEKSRNELEAKRKETKNKNKKRSTLVKKQVENYCNVEEQEDDIVEEEKSRNELEAKRKETKNKNKKRSTLVKKQVENYCNVEEQEDDIVEEEKSWNELEAKRKETKNKNEKGSVVKKQVEELYPKQELPVEFMKIIQELEGCDVVLVMDKLLTNSDVQTGLGRLSIPRGQIKNKFLTEKEERDVKEKEKAIQVRLIEPCLAVSKLCFKRWKMTNSWIYVLLSCWQKVSGNPDNGLIVVKEKKTVRVQLWAFRAGSERQLCFALVNVGPVHLCRDNGATTSSSSKEKQGNGDDGTISSQANGDFASSSGDSATIVQPQEQCSH